MSFDWSTFALEILNFALLVWILGRFVFRPLRARIQERRDQLRAEVDGAAEERAAAQKLREQLEERAQEIHRLGEEALLRAREEAAAERARILESAHEDAQAAGERVQSWLERERRADEAQIGETAIDLALELTERLLGEIAPHAIHRALLEQLAGEVGERIEELRRALQGEGMSSPPELTSAEPLEPEQIASIERALEPLGAAAVVTACDPALRAGATLRVADWVLDASARGQLGFLRERARRALAELAPVAPALATATATATEDPPAAQTGSSLGDA